MSEERFPWVPLSSSQLRAEVDCLGAQLSRLQDASGRDLLWDGNPSVWNGRAPLLFPIVGTLNGGVYRVGAKRFQLPRHGLARTRRFEVVSASATEAIFRLSADDTTLAVYPFRFQLDVHFAITGAALSVTSWVRNAGDCDMPASFGYHPAFRWPLPFDQPRAGHFIEFATDEPDPVRRLSSSGLVTAVLHPTPVSSRRLLLEDDLFTDDVIIFDEVRSRFVTYGASAGPRIRVSYPDAPYLGLWSKPGAGFICIEPWHGMSDPEGFAGDFSRKPGVFTVKPAEAVPIRMTIELMGESGAGAGITYRSPLRWLRDSGAMRQLLGLPDDEGDADTVAGSQEHRGRGNGRNARTTEGRQSAQWTVRGASGLGGHGSRASERPGGDREGSRI